MKNLTDPPRPAAPWRTLAVAALVLASLAAPAGAQQTAFASGQWRLAIDYDAAGGPECYGAQLVTQVAVDRRGLVSGYLSNPAAGSYYISGSLAPDGTVRRLVADGVNHFVFVGSFAGDSGEGRWQARDNGCRGAWSAERMP